MRHLLLSVPVLALSACSFFSGDGYGPDDYYTGGCNSACTSGHSYSVAEPAMSQPVYDTPSASSYHTQNHYVENTSPNVAYHTEPVHQGAHSGYMNNGYGLRGMHKPKKSAYTYGNVGLIAYDLSDGGLGLVGRTGYQSSGILGAEVEGTVGVKGMSFTQGASDVSGGQEYSAAAFAVARLPITNKISALARGGYHFTNIDSQTRTGGVDSFDTGNVSGFAYGVGGEYALNERDSLRLDFTRYEYDEVINAVTYDAADAVSLAYNHRF